jgi:hypothetical protein
MPFQSNGEKNVVQVDAGIRWLYYPIRALGFERRSFLQNKQVLRRRGIVAYGEEGKCLIMKQK